MEAASTRPRKFVRPWLVTLGLIALIGGTSVAVASVSVWLVPPYLALMGWMLFGPSHGPSEPAARPISPADGASRPPDSSQPALPGVGVSEHPSTARKPWRRRGRARSDESEASANSKSGPTSTETEEPGPASDGSVDATEPASSPPLDNPSPSDEPPPTRKGRKRRGRGSKAQAPPAQESPPVEVVWERVGPSQFVRREVPANPNSDSESDTPPEADDTEAIARLDSQAEAISDPEAHAAPEPDSELSRDEDGRSITATGAFDPPDPITPNADGESNPTATLDPIFESPPPDEADFDAWDESLAEAEDEPDFELTDTLARMTRETRRAQERTPPGSGSWDDHQDPQSENTSAAENSVEVEESRESSAEPDHGFDAEALPDSLDAVSEDSSHEAEPRLETISTSPPGNERSAVEGAFEDGLQDSWADEFEAGVAGNGASEFEQDLVEETYQEGESPEVRDWQETEDEEDQEGTKIPEKEVYEDEDEVEGGVFDQALDEYDDPDDFLDYGDSGQDSRPGHEGTGQDDGAADDFQSDDGNRQAWSERDSESAGGRDWPEESDDGRFR